MKKLFNKKSSDKFRNNNQGSYGGDRRFNRGGDKEFTPLCKATCAECGHTCQVPFKPTGSKPVYCNACFRKQGYDDGIERFGAKRFNRSNRDDKPAYKNQSRDRQPNRDGNDEVVNQLRTLNKKMDSLMQILKGHEEKTESEKIEKDDVINEMGF